ncbi:MAG: type II secretion system protein, partial [Patescibacteria group bacterium]
MRGFTLIEVLLAVLLIGVLASAAVPAFQSFQQRSDLAVAIDAVAQRYRRAQALSRAVSGDSPWGVHVATGSVIVFRGISFAGRNASYDELVVLGRS